MRVERTIHVRVRDGLHARPATQFVKLAKTFSSEIEVVRDGEGASAKSSVRLMLLGVKEDDELVIRASGEDAAIAVDALTRFMETPDAGLEIGLGVSLGGEPGSDGRSRSEQPKVGGSAGTAGVPASEGCAIGPIHPFFRTAIDFVGRRLQPESIGRELSRFDAAVDDLVSGLSDGGSSGTSGDDRQIVAAVAEIVRDPVLVADVRTRIEEGEPAPDAVIRVGEELARGFELMEDEYIRARGADVRDITRTLAAALLGLQLPSLSNLPVGSIVVCDDISAWDFARAPLKRLGGLVATSGSSTSHVAIMARAHRIPAVLGYRGDLEALRRARTIALNGSTGEVVLDPSESEAALFREMIRREDETRQKMEAFTHVAPRTKQGTLIEVAANLGSLTEVESALAAGAMGVGLFRTELLFMERRTLPSEDEQTAIYSELARAFDPRPVIVRTLDVGGDKPCAGIDFPEEQNPFLGWRGIRMCLDRPDIFRPQLKALLRAAVTGNIKVMVPMIADIGELRAVKVMLDDCRAELRSEGRAFGDFDLGVMIETPAAALVADTLAEEADFFSIGTNDLTQYVMAADRLNPRLVALNKPDHPAVLKAVELICQAATRHGIWVGVCGEAAAREDLIPTFLRLGVTELSMSPTSIPRAKRCILSL